MIFKQLVLELYLADYGNCVVCVWLVSRCKVWCGALSLMFVAISHHTRNLVHHSACLSLLLGHFISSLSGSLLDQMHRMDDSGIADTRYWIWLTWRFFWWSKFGRDMLSWKGVSENVYWSFVNENLFPESWLKSVLWGALFDGRGNFIWYLKWDRCRYRRKKVSRCNSVGYCVNCDG